MIFYFEILDYFYLSKKQYKRMLSNYEENFPTFSEVKSKKQKKNSHNPAEDCSVASSPVGVPSTPKTSEKYLICKTVLSGGDCPYKGKCKYAHYEDEWIIQECSHGERCNRIKGTKCKNVDLKNICLFIHPHEDLTAFYKRLNIDIKKITRPSEEEIAKSKHFSKMCDSFFLGVACNKPEGECTYAHNKEQLIVRDCMFKDKCNHTIFYRDVYVNNSSIVCMFKHPEETFENYNERVLEPRRKVVLQQHSEREDEKKSAKISSLSEIITSESIPIVKSWADIMEEEDEIPVEMPTKEESIKEEKPTENEGKIIIEVPENMAMDILKMMLASGKTNFELKIKK